MDEQKCQHCGSTQLRWSTHNENTSGVAEGRLRTHEISCIFVLGCDYCSETIEVCSAESIAYKLNGLKV